MPNIKPNTTKIISGRRRKKIITIQPYEGGGRGKKMTAFNNVIDVNFFTFTLLLIKGGCNA